MAENSAPIVTVLIPAFNSEGFIRNSIKSVLGQSFSNFELLIIDDGSTDETVEIVKYFNDKRIKLIQNDRNLGISETLNRGINIAGGKYIARMDADDIAMPNRLSTQIDFLEKRQDISIVGSWVKLFDKSFPFVDRKPIGNEVLSAYLIFDTPLWHPTVMIKKQDILKYNLYYNPTYRRAQDFELWSRADDKLKLDNIPKVLLKFRMHQKSVTQSDHEESKRITKRILKHNLEKLEEYPDDKSLLFHQKISRCLRLKNKDEVNEAEKRLLYLRDKNIAIKKYSIHGMDTAVGMIWFRLCRNSTHLGPWILKKYMSSILMKKYNPDVNEKIWIIGSVFYNLIKNITCQNKEGS